MLHSALLVLATALHLLAAPPATPPAQAPRIPESAFVDSAPAGAKCVAEAKKQAKKGDTVVVKAKIGGRAEPFVRNRAIFMVADRCLKSCDENPEETCPRPWDYCCESPESKRANMATIQFVDAAGKPIKTGAQGVRDLEPLALIVVEGVVSEIDDKGTFVIDARKVFLEKKAPKRDAK